MCRPMHTPGTLTVDVVSSVRNLVRILAKQVKQPKAPNRALASQAPDAVLPLRKIAKPSCLKRGVPE